MINAGLGASLGALIRYLITLVWKKLPVDWPGGTLLINVSGAFLLGLLTAHASGDAALMTFWGVGVLGGYTTFSTFNTEMIGLLDEKRYGLALVYLLLTYLFGLLAAGLGLLL